MAMVPGRASLQERFSAQSRSVMVRLVLIVLLLNLLVFVVAVVSLSHSRTGFQQQAAVTVQNLSRLLEGQVAADIEKVDLTLQAAAERIEHRLAAGRIDAPEMNVFLLALEKRLPEISGLRVADAHGRVSYGSGIPAGKPVNVSDREYFIRQRDTPSAGRVVMSMPVLTRIGQQWAIPISRRLQNPDRSFAGVVYANYTLEHLRQTFVDLDVGNDGVVALYNDRFEVVIRDPGFLHGEQLVGKQLPPTGRFRELASHGWTSGEFQARSAMDGIERTVSFRKVANTPFYVLVGRANDSYLAQWRVEVMTASALALLFLAITLLSAWMIHRDWKRHAALSHLLIQQSRLAAMGEMISNIAHQWRQPLNILSMIVQNLQLASSTNTLDKAALDKDFESMMAQVWAMSTTIEDFRKFFSPDKVAQDFLLRDTVQSTLGIVGPALKGIAVKLADGRGIMVRGYANELAQVLVNVLTNARDAIRGRQMADGRIDIAVGSDGGQGWVTVRDNAGGVPDEVLPKIFDHYFTTKESGSGIGLYMSKMIMNHMGGDIEVKNVEEGAEFTIRLPLARAG